MRQNLCMVAMRRESVAPRLPSIGAVRKVTNVADVAVIERKMSKTGLYSLDNITVRPDAKPDEKKPLLAKCKEKLSKAERADLEEQGVKILWIREAPGIPGMVGGLSDEKYSAKPDDMYGTKVVPYLMISRRQAESIETMAEQMPLPEEPKRHVPKLPEGMVMSMAWVGPGC